MTGGGGLATFLCGFFGRTRIAGNQDHPMGATKSGHNRGLVLVKTG